MMHRRSTVVGLIAVAIIAALSVPASAGVVLDWTLRAGTVHRADGPGAGNNWTIGSLFQVGANALSVTALGVQDSSAAGPTTDGFFSSPISVGLWSWNGSTATLVASTTVASGDPLGADSYRYKTLTTPVTLTAGAQYLIGARVGGGIEWFEDNGAGTAPFASGDANITLLGNRYYGAAVPLTAPTLDGGATLGRWGAANAVFTVIPTPAALPAGLGLIALLATRRRN